MRTWAQSQRLQGGGTCTWKGGQEDGVGRELLATWQDRGAPRRRELPPRTTYGSNGQLFDGDHAASLEKIKAG